VPSDLVSGPDLGAGYLHQLSIDRSEDRTTFTYHAQEGGQDANGPPIGGLDPLGYSHPSAPCQFGGPRCWHRRFLLPFDATPRVRQAYNRSRFVLDTMLQQAFADRPIAVDEALQEIVRRVGPAFDREGIPWFVGGATAARLLGGDLRPRAIRLGTDRAGVDQLGGLLAEFLIEPVATTDRRPARIVRGGRAFVGTFVAGARAEWAVPLEPDPTPGSEEWAGRPGDVRTLTVRYGGQELRVSRPEYTLVRTAARADRERADRLIETVRRIGPDRALLRSLLSRGGVPKVEADRLWAGLGA
jgi:hypothetical protein